MPLYIEGISPEVFKKAKRKMLANYADSLDFKAFFKNSIENLMRRDISWGEKAVLGNSVLKVKIKSN